MDRSSVNDFAAWGTSRRTLVRGAAWTVPAVALASTAPAFAGTTLPTVTSTFAQAQFGLAEYGDADLTWTISDAPVAVGSTFTVTVVNGSPGGAEAIYVNSFPDQMDGPIGNQYYVGDTVTLTYTVVQEIPVGASVKMTLGTDWPGSSYSGSWSASPSNSSTGTFSFTYAGQWSDGPAAAGATTVSPKRTKVWTERDRRR